MEDIMTLLNTRISGIVLCYVMDGKRTKKPPVHKPVQASGSGRTIMSGLNVTILGVAVSWITFLILEVAADQCPSSSQCTCSFDDGTSSSFSGGGSDSRTTGLAAATGALSSMVLAGGGLALWKFFKNKGGGEINDMYGRPPSSQGSWMDDKKDPSGPNRRGSYPYSDDGYDGRMTAASGRSNVTNIYKHGSKIWPGSR